MLKDSTPAFSVLWLKDIPDDEEKTIKLPIWKGELKKAETNVLDEYGDRIGEMEVTLIFWRGLSSYHYMLAQKDPNVADVMEVLDCAEDNDDVIDANSGMADDDHAETSSSSSSSSDDENHSDGETSDGLERRKELFKMHKKQSSNLDSDGKRGAVGSLREYRDHRKQLHRRNRGLMQWKGPRTVEWMVNKVERGGKRVGGLLSHHERDAGVETEV
jgi:hypothetical protein